MEQAPRKVHSVFAGIEDKNKNAFNESAKSSKVVNDYTDCEIPEKT